MSPFAGIFGAWPESAAGLLHEWVQPQSTRPSGGIQKFVWKNSAFFGRPASFFHCSRRQLCVLVEGNFTNQEEIGPITPLPEVVAGLYEKHGFAKCLEEIAGDFSIALYDAGLETLFLGRDRLGVRPLYYCQLPGRFGFSSRPLWLARLPGVGSGLNRDYVVRYAVGHYRYIDNQPQESPYAKVAQVPAGHWLSLGRKSTGPAAFWRLQDLPDWPSNENTLMEQYRELLLNSVRRRLRAAQRPAFTLSGGMDSSSVLAAAAYLTKEKFHAFSSVYSDLTYDESEDIQPMLMGPVAQWHPVPVDHPDIFAQVRKMVKAHQEPVATATWLSHFLVCKKIAEEGFDAVFGGLGGDELNAGEYEHFFYYFADLKATGQVQRLAGEIDLWAAHHDHPLWKKNRETAEITIKHTCGKGGHCLPDKERMQRYFRALNPDYADLAIFAPVTENPFASYLKNRTWQDLSRETTPCCLRAEERQTSVFGLQNFVPFLDHRLVEFMFRVPGTMKIRNGVTKILLREAMRGILPEITRARIKKTGWNAPAHLWLSGKNGEIVKDMIRTSRFSSLGIYRKDEVDKIVDEHQQIVQGRTVAETHMMFLWQVVNLVIWTETVDET